MHICHEVDIDVPKHESKRRQGINSCQTGGCEVKAFNVVLSQVDRELQRRDAHLQKSPSLATLVTKPMQAHKSMETCNNGAEDMTGRMRKFYR
jgi:hypothetical protein